MYTDLGSRRLALRRASSTVSNHSRVLAIGFPRADWGTCRISRHPVILTLGAVKIQPVYAVRSTFMSSEGAEPVPGGHPDRIRWNARYAARSVSSFTPHPLAVRALALDLPDGPVAELACGPSGSALLAAAHGRRVTAVDISEVALGLLGDEARRRGLGHLITLVHADLLAWSPEPRSHALVMCTRFWLAAAFTAAAGAVADGGLLAWQAYTAEGRRTHRSLDSRWCLAPGEPASLLPAGFTLLDQGDAPDRDQRLMLARQRTGP
jgi:SAM-dependent methyltransferase